MLAAAGGAAVPLLLIGAGEASADDTESGGDGRDAPTSTSSHASTKSEPPRAPAGGDEAPGGTAPSTATAPPPTSGSSTESAVTEPRDASTPSPPVADPVPASTPTRTPEPPVSPVSSTGGAKAQNRTAAQPTSARVAPLAAQDTTIRTFGDLNAACIATPGCGGTSPDSDSNWERVQFEQFEDFQNIQTYRLVRPYADGREVLLVRIDSDFVDENGPDNQGAIVSVTRITTSSVGTEIKVYNLGVDLLTADTDDFYYLYFFPTGTAPDLGIDPPGGGTPGGGTPGGGTPGGGTPGTGPGRPTFPSPNFPRPSVPVSGTTQPGSGGTIVSPRPPGVSVSPGNTGSTSTPPQDDSGNLDDFLEAAEDLQESFDHFVNTVVPSSICDTAQIITTLIPGPLDNLIAKPITGWLTRNLTTDGEYHENGCGGIFD